MPYLAVDLDGKKRFPLVAMAIGCSVGDVAWGLLELWELAWQRRSDIVTEVALKGCFGNAGCAAALVEFGFIKSTKGGFRVLGAEKYLKVATAQSDAGKAHSGNLKRGNSPGSSPAPSRLPLRVSPGSPSGSAPALTPNTQHPAPNKPNTIAGEKPPAMEVGEHQAIIDSMVNIFEAERREKYAFDGRDAKAIKKIRELGDKAEIERRFARAVTLTHPTIDNIHEMAKARVWNRCGASPPTGQPFDPNQGIIRHTAEADKEREWLETLEKRYKEKELVASL